MVEGTNEILANIKKLQMNNQRVARKAVKEAGELTEKILQKNTAKDTGALSADTTVSGIRGSGNAEMEVDIGFGTKEGWRAHFPDSGTIYQRAQNFSERTVEEARPQVIELYEERIKEGLEI